jgi:hypothetical protein
MDRLHQSYLRAQAAYEAQLPPGFDEPEVAEDCEGEFCGECLKCIVANAISAEEDAGEAEYERRKEKRTH